MPGSHVLRYQLPAAVLVDWSVCPEARYPLLEITQGVRPRLLTVAQAAVYLGRTETAVRFLASSGAFPTVRGDGRVQFDVQDLDRWIELNKTVVE